MQVEYPGLPHAEASNVIGQDSVVLMPAFLPFGHPTVTVFGGDRFVVEGVATYPNGEVYNMVLILRMQSGKVIEETVYFVAPFDAPVWRRQLRRLTGLSYRLSYRRRWRLGRQEDCARSFPPCR